MEIETITKLLDAGYTKAEIDAMQGGNNAGSESNEGAGKENKDAGKEQSNAGAENAGKVEQGNAGAENVGKAAQNIDINAAIENLTNTVTTLSNTVKAMQDANAKGARTDSGNAGQGITDAVQDFINKL